MLRLSFGLFTFAVGLCLLVFPWMPDWSLNSAQWLLPGLQGVWDHPSFRGAISGLGFAYCDFTRYEEPARVAHGPRQRPFSQTADK